jgi:hypothetical protein
LTIDNFLFNDFKIQRFKDYHSVRNESLGRIQDGSAGCIPYGMHPKACIIFSTERIKPDGLRNALRILCSA